MWWEGQGNVEKEFQFFSLSDRVFLIDIGNMGDGTDFEGKIMDLVLYVLSVSCLWYIKGR